MRDRTERPSRRRPGIRAAVMLERLKAAGLDVRRPWHESLVLLSTRGRSGLLRSRAASLEDVVHLAYDHPDELRALENVGRRTVAEIKRHIGELGELGRDGYLYGGCRPETLADAAVAILTAGDEVNVRILRERFIEGRTLTQITQARGISRQWTCELINRAIRQARVRFQDLLLPMLAPIVTDAQPRGGVLDGQALEGLSPGEIRLLLRVAGLR